jgi:hypothetical protein
MDVIKRHHCHIVDLDVAVAATTPRGSAGKGK